MKTNFDVVIEVARGCGLELTGMSLRQNVVDFEFRHADCVTKNETLAEALDRKVSNEGADKVRAFVEAVIAEAGK